MNERTRCSVPHCRRTRKAEPDFVTVAVDEWSDEHFVTVDLNECWICAAHWREVPSALRRLHTAAKRKARHARTLFAVLVSVRVFARCKRRAIEAAAGVA